MQRVHIHALTSDVRKGSPIPGLKIEGLSEMERSNMHFGHLGHCRNTGPAATRGLRSRANRASMGHDHGGSQVFGSKDALLVFAQSSTDCKAKT